MLLAPIALGAPACFDPVDMPDAAGDSEDAGTASDDAEPGTSGGAAMDDGAGTGSADGDTTGGAEDSTGAADPASTSESSGSDDDDADGSSETGEPDAVCGDGEVTGDEVCDDGVNDGSYGGCAEDCAALGPHCGDATPNGEEICDDGNADNGDGCNVDCIVSGTPLMTLTYDSPSHESDSAHSVAVDSQGDFVVVGNETRNDLGQGVNAWLRKYTEEGSVIWTRTFNEALSNGNETARAVDIDADDNIAINGYVNRSDLGQSDNVLTQIYAPNGDLVESVEFNNAGDSLDWGHGVGFDAAGNVYAGGFEIRNDLGESYNVRALKYDASLNLQWSTSYNNVNDGQDRCREFRTDSAGYGVCAGYEFRADLSEGFNHLVIKYDPDGNEEWVRTSHNPLSAEDTLWAVAISDSGEVVAAGRELRSDLGQDYDIFVRKYDVDGNELWTATHNGDGDGGDFCEGVAIDGDGNVIAVGRETAGDGDVGTWVRKYDPDGNVLWTDVNQSESGGIDYAIGVDTYPDGRVVAVGYEDHSDVGEDNNIWIRMYAP